MTSTKNQGPTFPDSLLVSPEKRSPEFAQQSASPSLKCFTFLITLSPKLDLSEQTISQFRSYITKKTKFAYVVTEHGENGKLHLHAAACFNYATEKRNIQDYWAKKMTVDYPGSIGRYACKVTIQYDHKWYNEYLRKGGNVIYDKYNVDAYSEYFPTIEQQRRLCELKGSPEIRMHILDEMLAEWIDQDNLDSSYESAVSYMKYRMYALNKTPYYTDARKLHDICWFLYEKRNKVYECNVDDRNYGARKSGNSICT